MTATGLFPAGIVPSHYFSLAYSFCSLLSSPPKPVGHPCIVTPIAFLISKREQRRILTKTYSRNSQPYKNTRGIPDGISAV